MSLRISRRELLAIVPLAAAASGRERGPFDAGECCLLPESAAGFRTLPADSRCGAALVVAGAGALGRRQAEAIRRHLSSGGSVLLESAMGLDSPQSGSPYFPYVDFNWPVRARIREFCPMRLNPGPGDRVIAMFRGEPAAIRRRAGRGTLIVVGSPVGPALLAGDRDAHRWAAAVLRWIHRHSEAHPCFYPRENQTKSISKRLTTRL